MVDLNKLELLNKARTPGEWECDGDETEGGWGRYQAYVIRTDKGRIADCVNADYQVSEIHEEGDEDGVHRWDEIGRRNFEFIAAAANGMSELIRLARIGTREEQHRRDIVDCAVKGLFPEQRADLLRLHEHFSDTTPEATPALITKAVDLGFVEKIRPGYWEFNELGEDVVRALKVPSGPAAPQTETERKTDG
jgi:hypothetical protein